MNLILRRAAVCRLLAALIGALMMLVTNTARSDGPAAVVEASGSWPAFLGVGADPVDPSTIPLEWSPATNIAWQAELPGYGQSSPVIHNGVVCVTTVDGPNKETLHIVSFDLMTGALLRDHEEKSSNPEKNTVYISRAAPTPVIDDDGIVAYFEGGDVIAVSHEGKLRWRRSLTADYGKPTNEFGLSASPVQTPDHVIVLVDDPATAYLVALRKSDGTVAWKTDRTARTSWSSPALLTLDGKPQVVCSSAGSVDGYDPQTGELLWTYTDVGGNGATTPRPAGDHGFLIAASPGRQGENSELARQSNGLMSVRQEAGVWKVQKEWINESASPSWASPVEYSGHAYWVNRVGAVFCVDAGSGETVYTERIRQSAWATPVGMGDRIYVFGKDGLTTVLAAGPEFRVLAENALWTDENLPVNKVPVVEEEDENRRRAAAMFSAPTLYGVAVVNGAIVLRSGSQLWCVAR